MRTSAALLSHRVPGRRRSKAPISLSPPPIATASSKPPNGYLSATPVTVTASHSERSPGGPHDFYSEGDYWWPDPKNPTGPYIRRDGYSNPANFNEHREAMVRLSLIVPALTAAWLLTRQKKYCRSRRATSACLVRRPCNKDEPEPRICAGDLRGQQRARHRHHRHAPSRRSRSRSNLLGNASALNTSRRNPPLVCRLP